MAKNNTLPEHIVDDPNSILSKQSKSAHKAREKVNEYSTQEKEWKEKISKNSKALREIFLDEEPPKVIGKITIAPPEQTATRVEFRINNGSLDVDEMDNLDRLFGGARPELFEKAVVVDKITDPDALIDALKKSGLNPWDYLTLHVREDTEQVVIEKGTGIITAEAILPRTGFLATLKSLVSQFSNEAKKYIRLYLKEALKPTVVLRTKAKK